MLTNPFTPVFGGKPEVFFGRKELLAQFRTALVDPSSENRALFVTGTRGSGKTALLERLSQLARAVQWRVIDLGPDRAVHTLVRELAGFDEETRSLSPQVSVSVLGSGGSFGGVATSKTDRIDEADLTRVLLRACEQHPKGIMVNVDEIQKVPEDDVSLICNAFQMASRKGYDVILVVAGLPYAHDEIIHYKGCTYMRRARHAELGLLSWDDSIAAIRSAFAANRGLDAEESVVEQLVQASYGHPYMLQLLGYYLIVTLNENGAAAGHHVSAAEAHVATNRAICAYEARALQPLMSELSGAERAYLLALSHILDDDRVGKTSEVAFHLGKKPNAVTYLRDSLLRNGIVITAGRGLLMFNVPYLAGYVQKRESEPSNLQLVRQWRV